MKTTKYFRPVVGLLFLCCLVAPVLSKPVFFSLSSMQLAKVKDFPNTVDFNSEYGYFDAGVKYKQFSLFFIPIWNYEKEWCGFVAGKNHYITMSESEIRDLADNADIILPNSPSIPAWDAWGGKVLFEIWRTAS